MVGGGQVQSLAQSPLRYGSGWQTHSQKGGEQCLIFEV
jgi:hypothetical protein